MIRLAALLVILPLAAGAGAWEEFEARCLTPYEAIFPPIIAGLKPAASKDDAPGYWLSSQEKLVIELAPDDGLSACHLVDFTGQSEQGFDAWISKAVATGRYVREGANLWHSFEWIEPVLAVSKRREGDGVILRILETDLES